MGRKKGFLARIMETLDNKLKAKAAAAPTCACNSKGNKNKKSCC
jgi:hypothetical protein